MKNSIYIVIFICAVVLSGCANTPQGITKRDAFPNMYDEQPRSILVLPAINKSTAAAAPDYYLTTIAEPLTQKGFYVLPIPVTSMLLKQEGVVDGAQLRNTNLGLFKQHFDADAVMFVTINKWDTSYTVLAGSVTVGIGFELVSTKSANVLWHYETTVVINTSGNNNGGAGLLGALIATAINTMNQDYIPIARNINNAAVTIIPAGPYSGEHNLDQQSPGYVQPNAAGAAY